jgi:hypothetical protein
MHCGRKTQNCKECGHHYPRAEYELTKCPECGYPRACEMDVAEGPDGKPLPCLHHGRGAGRPITTGKRAVKLKQSLADAIEAYAQRDDLHSSDRSIAFLHVLQDRLVADLDVEQLDERTEARALNIISETGRLLERIARIESGEALTTKHRQMLAESIRRFIEAQPQSVILLNPNTQEAILLALRQGRYSDAESLLSGLQETNLRGQLISYLKQEPVIDTAPALAESHAQPGVNGHTNGHVNGGNSNGGNSNGYGSGDITEGQIV